MIIHLQMKQMNLAAVDNKLNAIAALFTVAPKEVRKKYNIGQQHWIYIYLVDYVLRRCVVSTQDLYSNKFVFCLILHQMTDLYICLLYTLQSCVQIHICSSFALSYAYNTH